MLLEDHKTKNLYLSFSNTKLRRKMKKLYRSNQDKKISGVCSGLGNYFNIDPALIRLLFIFLMVFTGFLPVIIAYFILVLIIPIEPRSNIQRNYKRLYRSQTDKKLAGVCGGLAEFLKMDSTLIRIIYIVLLIFTALVPMTIIYAIAWLVIP